MSILKVKWNRDKEARKFIKNYIDFRDKFAVNKAIMDVWPLLWDIMKFFKDNRERYKYEFYYTQIGVDIPTPDEDGDYWIEINNQDLQFELVWDYGHTVVNDEHKDCINIRLASIEFEEE